MKKILRFDCGEIAYDEKYIAVTGNRVGLIDRTTDEVLNVITKAGKNIIGMKIMDGYIYTKTTVGTYYMYNLKENELAGYGYCKERQNTSFSGNIFVYSKGVILDILPLKDEQYYLVKYDFLSKTYEKVCIAKANYCCRDWLIDYQEREVYILSLEKNWMNQAQTNCYISVVNIDDLRIKTVITVNLKKSTTPIMLIDKTNILLKDMKIYNTDSKEMRIFNSYDCLNDRSLGYLSSFYLDGKENLILTFSNRVLIFNLKTGELYKSYPCQYGDSAVLIDGKVYIATWKGLFVDDIESKTDVKIDEQ